MRLADSFGVATSHASTPGELAEAITEALRADEPWLIHVPVGPMPDPWKFVHMGPVRG
jgi:acetolactate synthase-1/2/3 large subunit